MDKKQKSRLQRIIRDEFKISDQYKEVQARSKIDKALFKCECCGKLVYEGTSIKNYDEYKVKYKAEVFSCKDAFIKKYNAQEGSEVIKEKLEVDHIQPVIPYDRYYYELDWNEFFDRTFCGTINLQYICKTTCHKEKNKKESEVRKLLRKERRENEG